MDNKAHEGDWQAQSFGAQTWREREPEPGREPYGIPHRTCSYCGSINPSDLLDALKAGARLQATDWKYGWPHKFYVEGIPNPNAGKTVEVGSNNDGPIMGLAPVHSFAKWYSTHFKDCPKEQLAELAKIVLDQTGIEFIVGDAGLGWRGTPKILSEASALN